MPPTIYILDIPNPPNGSKDKDKVWWFATQTIQYTLGFFSLIVLKLILGSWLQTPQIYPSQVLIIISILTDQQALAQIISMMDPENLLQCWARFIVLLGNPAELMNSDSHVRNGRDEVPGNSKHNKRREFP